MPVLQQSFWSVRRSYKHAAATAAVSWHPLSRRNFRIRSHHNLQAPTSQFHELTGRIPERFLSERHLSSTQRTFNWTRHHKSISRPSVAPDSIFHHSHHPRHDPKSAVTTRFFSNAPSSPIDNEPNHHSQTGLFSIPGLVFPSDFHRLTRQAIQDSNDLRAQIPNDPDTAIATKQQAVSTLYMLDKISQIVCNVIDAAELCRSAHASAEWRQAADQAFGSLQDYIVTLNTDKTLYNALVTIEHKFYTQLTEEEQRFCFLLKREFELDGIHLPDEQRQEVKELHSQVTTLESLYMSNITYSSKQFAVDAALVESVIPRHVLQDHGAIYDDDENGNDKPKVHLTADSPITHSITSFAPSGDLRRQVYLECMTSCVENMDCLQALRNARHHLALSLGFPSYAHRFLQDKMAQSPQNVSHFLQDLHQRIQPLYKQDMELLLRAKQQVEGPSQQVEPWDIKFYTKLIKSQQGLDPNQLVPYLSLHNTLEATQMLVQRLFGIQMRSMKLEEAERWDVEYKSNITNQQQEETIHKYVFTEEATGRELGTMYLDLHPRPGKYTHAAHFTVRCGCLLTNHSSDGHETTPEYQKPIVALVCNMNTGQASFSSHQEVETFLHEFGHALHSLLSRTNFQHMSGTRAAMDFVETPSHWMEHFAWDEGFLPHLAKHEQTGDPISPEMMSALTKSRSQFRFLEMQNQIVLASFDQAVFGAHSSSDGNSDAGHPQQLWEAMHRQYNVPFASGTHWFTNVGHLVTYGAGYYGYLYSQVFADAIWNQLFKSQSMKRDAGVRLWKTLLQHGGAKDPNTMLEELLGQKPTVETYWKSIHKP